MKINVLFVHACRSARPLPRLPATLPPNTMSVRTHLLHLLATVAQILFHIRFIFKVYKIIVFASSKITEQSAQLLCALRVSS